MPATQRPDHRAAAFARCGLRSIGADAPAIQRQTISGHNAATPGSSNSLSVHGAPATRVIHSGHGARQKQRREHDTSQRVQLEERDDELSDCERHGVLRLH